MELSFLRSQVSPHFMFNALNSMVSLAGESDLLEPALLKKFEPDALHAVTIGWREGKPA